MHTVYDPIIGNALGEVTYTTIPLSKDWEDGLSAYVAGSKDSSRRDGNDTHLTALFTKWGSLVHARGPIIMRITNQPIELLERQQGSETLHELTYLSSCRHAHPHYVEQSVDEGVLPWKRWHTTVGLTDGSFKQPWEAVQLLEECLSRELHVRVAAIKIPKDQILQPTIISTFRPGTLSNRVLAGRCMYPRPISQLISKPYRHSLFNIRTDIIRTTVGLGNISGMGYKPFSDTSTRRNGERPRTPSESKCAPGLRLRKTLKPPLKRCRHILDVVRPLTRKRNVTEGYADSFHLVAYPVNTSRTGFGYPFPEVPAPMLLRNTRGNETCPYSLPRNCMGIDFTPMGLTSPSLSGRGQVGTYYTAKKGRW